MYCKVKAVTYKGLDQTPKVGDNISFVRKDLIEELHKHKQCKNVIATVGNCHYMLLDERPYTMEEATAFLKS